jgi:hypothetical protein
VARKIDEMRGITFGWTIANVIGFGVLGVLSLVASSLAAHSGIFLGSLVVGFPVGLAQWIALRRHTKVSVVWVISVSLGLFIAIWALQLIPDGLWGFADDESTSVLVLSYVFIGFLIGTVQWLLLRNQFSRSLVRLLASAVGTGVAFWLVLDTGLINVSGLFSAIVAVLVYAGVMGLTLEWMRSQNATTLSRSSNAT